MSRPAPSSSAPGGLPSEPGSSTVIHRNIGALIQVRQREERRKSVSERIADAVTRFAGSMWCVYVHGLLFGGWIICNLGWIAGVRPWDPFPFVMLAMIASVEAIFLSTFILISQNHMARIADRRAELSLQISLLSEHELTRVVQMLDAIAQRLDVPRPPEAEMDDIKQDIQPEKVAEQIERAEAELGGKEGDGAGYSAGGGT
jgi:uncharacterized membrane protein